MSRKKDKEEKRELLDISVSDLEVLDLLRGRYHLYYQDMSKIPPRIKSFVTDETLKKDEFVGEMIDVYVRQVMVQFPYLLDKIEIQKNLIEHQKGVIKILEDQRKKAFLKLGWPVSDANSGYVDLSPRDVSVKKTRKKKVKQEEEVGE